MCPPPPDSLCLLLSGSAGLKIYVTDRSNAMVVRAGTEEERAPARQPLLSDRTRRKLWIPFLVVLVALFFAHPDPPFADEVKSKIQQTKLPEFASSFVSQWKEIASLPDFSLSFAFQDAANGTSSMRPGLRAAEKGMKKKYPIVIVPGATTTGLEIWKGKQCAGSYFKQRLWGSFTMLSSFAAMDGACWLEHISMNLTTGLDPDGIKVRPSEGLSNVEYFMPGFWIWAPIVESLADIGYDTSDLYVHPYDWRMDASRLEKRDGLLTRMKYSFESSLAVHGIPAAVLTHSYGNTLMR